MTLSYALSPELERKAQQFRQALVESMVACGVIPSAALRTAFTSTPREAFVPFFYERGSAAGRKMAWTRLDPTRISPEQYLALMYRDEPLVTSLDQRGWPNSSSSMPSAMARMLEALQVESGQRVLEIGTGTGYNAALIAALTGYPRLVTSIEIDAVLAANAASRLNDVVGSEITVQTGDGFAGYPEHAPYERIIATASAPVVPRPWVEQLAPGGKLVMDLQGSLTSGFLVLEKHNNEKSISGHFLAHPLYFMPMMTEAIATSELLTTYERLLQQPCSESFVLEMENPFPDVLKENAFRWFLQWRIAGCQVRERSQLQRDSGLQIKTIFVIDSHCKTLVRLQQIAGEGWRGSVYGSRHLWHDLQHAYEEWIHLGKPAQSAYHLELDAEGHTVLVIGALRLLIY